MNTILDKKHARLQLYTADELSEPDIRVIHGSPTLDDSHSVELIKNIKQLLPARDDRLYTEASSSKLAQIPSQSLFRKAPTKKKILKSVKNLNILKHVSAAEILVKKMAKDFRISIQDNNLKNRPQSSILNTSLGNLNQSHHLAALTKLFNTFSYFDIESVFIEVGAGSLEKDLLSRGLVHKPETRVLGYQSTKVQNNLAMIEAGKNRSDKSKAEKLRKVSVLLNR